MLPTISTDDYLKAIYQLAGEHGRASTTSLARRLGVQPASVTGMLHYLAGKKPALVIYEKRHGVRLAPAGRRRALEMIRHHRLIELFLHRCLGYSWDEVHEDAERLEHAISEKLEARIARYLNEPESDPHGHPIPRLDGSVPERTEIALADLSAGERARVSSVRDGEPEMLRYLAGLGMQPGAELEVVKRAPFDGPVTVRVKKRVGAHALGARVAAAVRVSRVPKKRKQAAGAGP